MYDCTTLQVREEYWLMWGSWRSPPGDSDEPLPILPMNRLVPAPVAERAFSHHWEPQSPT